MQTACGRSWATYGCLALLAALLSGCDRTGQAQTPAAELPSVGVTRPVVKAIRTETAFFGRAEAIRRVEICARVAGKLVSVKQFTQGAQSDFQEGSLVEEGRLLFCIDREPLEARVRAAGAMKRHAETLVQLAQQSFAAARQRRETAAEGETKQTAIRELQPATAAFEEATAAATVAELELQNAEAALKQCEIRAPMAGWVGERLVDDGNFIEIGRKLTTILATDEMRVQFDVGQRELLRLQRYQSAAVRTREPLRLRITIEDDGEYDFEGTIDYVAQELDPLRGTGRVRARVPNRVGKLVPGMVVKVRVPSETTADAVLVEPRAVRTDWGGKYLWVAAGNDHVQQRYVELGDTADGLRVVTNRRNADRTAGLNADESYVTDGLVQRPPGASTLIAVRMSGGVPLSTPPAAEATPAATVSPETTDTTTKAAD